MRLRVNITKKDAESICRLLMTLANNVDNLLLQEQLNIDFARLNNHLVTVSRKGNRLTSFTLDGLTIALLSTEWAEKSLMFFDEPNQHIIRYAIRETISSAEESLSKKSMKMYI